MSALDLIVRESLDKDAAEYCRRSGASDKRAINAFVRGVKDLGLWESMVCWPLRSEQNAGTGTTAYSLGGLGTFNGTLTNGPVWGVDGVTFSGTNYIDIRFGSSRSPANLVVASVSRSSSTQPAGFPYDVSVSSNDYGSNGLSVISFGTNGATLVGEAVPPNHRTAVISNTSDVYKWVQAQKTASQTLFRLNAATVTPLENTNSPSVDRLIAGGRWAGNVQSSTGPFGVGWAGDRALVVYAETSQDLYSQIYALYKQTLGTGLGLP
jgi:hypothetical protein